MKRLHYVILCLVAVLMATSVSAQRNPDANRDGVLRILAIGNSFSDDGMEYLPKLLEHLNIENVEVARLYVGGCSLKQHVEFYEQEKSPYQFYHSTAGENKWVKTKGESLKNALQMGEWDIITMQQVSGQSGKYESYKPYLEKLVAIVREAQPKAHLAWHMTWAYGTESTHGDFPKYNSDQEQMYNEIRSTVQQMLKEYDYFDYLIPTGTAVQMLRQTPINNTPKDLTRDGFHLGYGVGRYAAACVWYETLIKPFTHQTMLGNGLFVMKGDQYADRYIAAYCERAAVMVTKKPFDVRPIKSVYRLATKPLNNIYFVFDIDKLVEDKEAYLKSVKPFARRIVQDWKYNEYLNIEK